MQSGNQKSVSFCNILELLLQVAKRKRCGQERYFKTSERKSYNWRSFAPNWLNTVLFQKLDLDMVSVDYCEVTAQRAFEIDFCYDQNEN